MTRLLLAGDVGGTKTLLGAFDGNGPRPRTITVGAFSTLGFPDLGAMVADFLSDSALADAEVETACFGVAGPVIGRSATLTNVPWTIDADSLVHRFNFSRVTLLNDLQAMAYAVPVLERGELHALQEGQGVRGGNIALIAAGTGLGEALLHNIDGVLIPSATEAGHADFAARTEREIGVLRALSARFGRVDVERVVSGPGISNLARVTHVALCAAGIDLGSAEAPASISAAALERRCPACVEALDIFIEAYGAEAGNLALRSVATGGVFVGGGIAPKILPALSAGGFIRAFNAKAPLERVLESLPVNVILNPQAGLLGAAVYAAKARPA